MRGKCEVVLISLIKRRHASIMIATLIPTMIHKRIVRALNERQLRSITRTAQMLLLIVMILLWWYVV